MNCFETQHRAVSQKLICLPLFRARSTFVRRSPEENGIGHPFSAVSQLVEKSFFDKLTASVRALFLAEDKKTGAKRFRLLP